MTSGHARSRSRCHLIRSCEMLHFRRCALTKRTLWHQPLVSSSLNYQNLLAKNVRRPDDVIMWPQMTFQREMMLQRAGNIKHNLSDYDSGWVGQIWCIWEVPTCFHHWLIMGRSRNWHELNIQIVDTYVVIVHCEFQRVRITGVPLARCQTSKNATWVQVN